MAVLADLRAAAHAARSADEKQRAGVSQPLVLARDGRSDYVIVQSRSVNLSPIYRSWSTKDENFPRYMPIRLGPTRTRPPVLLP
jgi:hypothetical protein